MINHPALARIRLRLRRRVLVGVDHQGFARGAEEIFGLRVNDHLEFVGEHAGDLNQLVRVEGREPQFDREAAIETFIHFQQITHLVFVTHQDHHQLTAIIFQVGHECLHHDRAEIVFAAARYQRWGLIDDEHTVAGLLHCCFRQILGVADVLADQVKGPHRKHVVGGQDAVAAKRGRRRLGDRRFPCPRRPEIHHVVGAHQGCFPISLAGLIEQDTILDTAPLFFDFRETDLLGHERFCLSQHGLAFMLGGTQRHLFGVITGCGVPRILA
ncbi:Uncharacterised protein [Mycobacteroides abscessus subsp. massiliense]|nr:Uncharacterised protein [Mycobacteroides abscessus subsp. massiliense]